MGEDYYLQYPLNQKFYKFVATMMTYASVGDRVRWGYKKNPLLCKIIRNTIVYFAPVTVISQIFFLYFNYSKLNFDILGIIFTIFPATVLGNVSCIYIIHIFLEFTTFKGKKNLHMITSYEHIALCLMAYYCEVSIYSSRFKSYVQLSKDFLPKIHIYNMYRDDKSKFIKDTLLFVEKFTRLTTYYVVFFFLMTWAAWISVTAVNNIVKMDLVRNHTVKLQTCIYFWMPFDYSYDYDRWLIIHIINCYTVFCGISAMMMFQSQNYIFIYNLIGHILILKHKIKTEFNENLTDTEVHLRLGKIVEYHTFICKVFKEVETAFGINVATNYLENLVGNGIVMFQLMYGGKENKILYIMMIMAYTGAPIMMSLVLEEIRRQTWDLSDVAYYELPWQNMSVQNQKIIMLIIQRMQVLMDFKAFGGLRAGVGPMISILKTTFSYYVMLKTTMNEED